MSKNLKYLRLWFCRECIAWLEQDKFITPEGLICRDCQIKRIRKILRIDNIC